MPKLTLKQRDQAAELVWKWALRLTGLIAFIYVATVKDFQVPSPAFVMIGGLIGLPHVIDLQRLLRSEREDRDE